MLSEDSTSQSSLVCFEFTRADGKVVETVICRSSRHRTGTGCATATRSAIAMYATEGRRWSQVGQSTDRFPAASRKLPGRPRASGEIKASRQNLLDGTRSPRLKFIYERYNAKHFAPAKKDEISI